MSGSPEVPQICCIIEEGQRCQSRATSATFNKKLLKSVSQRRQRFSADPEVSKVSTKQFVVVVRSVLSHEGLCNCTCGAH